MRYDIYEKVTVYRRTTIDVADDVTQEEFLSDYKKKGDAYELTFRADSKYEEVDCELDWDTIINGDPSKEPDVDIYVEGERDSIYQEFNNQKE